MGLVKAQFMTITALIVAAIGLSIIAILSTSNSSISQSSVNLNYNQLVEDEIENKVNLNDDIERRKFEQNLLILEDYNVRANLTSPSGSNCYDIDFRQENEVYRINCVQ